MSHCKRGMTHRKTYRRKLRSGRTIRVKGRCIRSQTRYTRPYVPSRKHMRGYSMKRRTLKTCPKGFIKRSSFVRKTRSGRKKLVPEQCIKNVGALGKGLRSGAPGIGPLRKGELAKYGYTNIAHMKVSDRHIALEKAIKEFGSLGVWRKLNAIHVYTRKLSPESSKKFKEDMDWIRTKFGIKAF